MTFESMSNDDQTLDTPIHNGTNSNFQSSLEIQSCSSKESRYSIMQTTLNSPIPSVNITISSTTQPSSSTPNLQPDQNLNTLLLSNEESCPRVCGSSSDETILEDEIRCKLDKLNALSDLINSLERQFNDANSLFRETLKCSTDRLSSLARTIGSKSIRQGRIYNAVKVSVEQSQTDCQRACVRFEKANQDHQFAKNAIRQAEENLKQITNENCPEKNFVIPISTTDNIDSLNFSAKLTLTDEQLKDNLEPKPCDTVVKPCTPKKHLNSSNGLHELENKPATAGLEQISPTTSIKDAARYSEDLNQALLRLIEAERERGLSEKDHMNQANKLMLAQEELTRLERDHSIAIRKTQYYFDESRRFNAKLNSVKNDICQISEEILAAKQAYARTLEELEKFSDDLHSNGMALKIK